MQTITRDRVEEIVELLRHQIGKGDDAIMLGDVSQEDGGDVFGFDLEIRMGKFPRVSRIQGGKLLWSDELWRHHADHLAMGIAK